MAHIFRYAIVRLVPYAHRGETLNVGIVVFCNDRLDVRFSAPPSLLDYFGIQSTTLDWVAENLVRIDNRELPLEERVSEISRFSGIQLSEIGWFLIDEPHQYEARISDIISEYVEKPKKIKRKTENSSLLKDLRRIFKDYSIYSTRIEDINKHKVISNMPVGPAGKLHVDFLLKNGNYHATETLDFRKSEDAGPTELKNAALASVTFRHARDVLGPEATRCYLVYAAPSVVEMAVSPALEIAGRDGVVMFNLESKEDKASYLDTILSAAGVNHLFN